ncbi:MAG: hypothetical protein AB8B71_00070 [Paracoccaceae bacterium]
MLQLNDASFYFAHTVVTNTETARTVWDRWSHVQSWNDWDASLKGTVCDDNGLFLGKMFSVVPHAAPGPIPVTVSSFINGQHFTTRSSGPMGELAFGHGLRRFPRSNRIVIEHSICAIPSDEQFFRANVWDRLQDDVETSVEALVTLCTPGAAK